MTEKFNYTTFYIRDRQIVDGSNCFFGLMTALSSQKLNDTKYRMWLQKDIIYCVGDIFRACHI